MTDLVVAVPPVSAGPLMSEVLGGPAVDGVVSRRTSVRRSAITIVGVALTVGVLAGLHEQILGGIRSIRELPTSSLVIIGCCVLGVIVTRASVNRLTHPETSIFRGFVIDQISLAASNALPGGALLGPAARYRVSRSFGHSPEQSAVGTFAAGQAFCFGRWLVILLVIGHEFAIGESSSADSMVLMSALSAVAVGVGVWIVLITESKLSHRLTGIVQLSVNRLGLRWVKFRNIDMHATVGSIRNSAQWMARRRALALICIGAFSTVASGAIVVVVVMSVGSEGDVVGAWELMRVYLLARIATSFVPTPGALAALDAALIAGLLASGVDVQVATAAVLIYRVTTFVLPIVVGAVTYFGWRRWSHLREQDLQSSLPSAD